ASYGLLLLPESLSVKNRERFRWRKANPLGSLVLLRSNPQLFSLGAVIFVQYLAFQVLPSIFTIYANYRIGWGITEVGLSLGLVGALSITVQVLVVKRFIERYGERIAMIVGILFGTAALLGSVALAVRLTTARAGSPIPSAPTPIPDGHVSVTATTIGSEETAEEP